MGTLKRNTPNPKRKKTYYKGPLFYTTVKALFVILWGLIIIFMKGPLHYYYRVPHDYYWKCTRCTIVPTVITLLSCPREHYYYYAPNYKITIKRVIYYSILIALRMALLTVSFLSLVKHCNHEGKGIYHLLSGFIFGISGTFISPNPKPL